MSKVDWDVEKTPCRDILPATNTGSPREDVLIPSFAEDGLRARDLFTGRESGRRPAVTGWVVSIPQYLVLRIVPPLGSRYVHHRYRGFKHDIFVNDIYCCLLVGCSTSLKLQCYFERKC